MKPIPAPTQSCPTLPAPHPSAVRFAERDAGGCALKSILVGVPPNCMRSAAVEKAARIAFGCGAAIELYLAEGRQRIPDSWAGGTTTLQYHELMAERRLEELNRLADPLRKAGIQVTCHSTWQSRQTETLSRHALRMAPDLVIVELPGPTLAPRTRVIRYDWTLMREIAAPLLMVHEREWPLHPRIAACVDPCRPAERPVALDDALVSLACRVGRTLAAHVELLHALQPVPHLSGEAVPSELQQRRHESDRMAVAKLAASHRLSEASIHFNDVRRPQGILDLIEALQPDLVVMGLGARGRLHAAMPDTPGELLDRIDCDVLIVKPPGFVSPLLTVGL